MATLTPIDRETWVRNQHFEHYSALSPCTYSLTVDINVTTLLSTLKSAGWNTYIGQIWALTTIVNRHSEFRMSLTEAGEPAVWSDVNPSFTVFNPERETFSCAWVPYDSDFASFHSAAAVKLESHRFATEFFPDGPPPTNSIDVSSLPWLEFSAMNLNIDRGSRHYLPIFTIGRFADRDGRITMPLAIQVHHAAADGFHVGRFVRELQDAVNDASWAAR